MKILLFSSVILAGSICSAQPETNPKVQLLRQLVTQTSGTTEIGGVKRVQTMVADELKKLNFTVEEIAADDTTIKAKQLVATRLGARNQFITFVTHADTVFEKTAHFEISEDGMRIKGSGVGDDKGGIVVGLFALREFLSQKPNPNYSLRFIISPTEETGSIGFRNQLKKYSSDSALILGMEPALENGSIVKARKGVRWYQIKVSGKEAHAGVNPDSGVNACHQLSIFVDKVMRLSNFKMGNTLSVGRIEGGKDKFNIVCGEAIAKIDFRFTDYKSAEKIDSQIRSLIKNIAVRSTNPKSEAKAELTVVTEVSPFPKDTASQNLINEYLKILKEKENIDRQAVLTGGAADLNYMSESSALMLDGLGPIGGRYHTTDEYIELPSLNSRTEALTQLLVLFDSRKN